MGKYSAAQYAKFIIPSVIGIFLFMVPVQFDGSWTIVIKIISDFISDVFADILPALCLAIVTISAILGIISLKRPSFITSYPVVEDTISTTPVWAVVRILGAIFIWLTFLGIDAGDDATGIIHMITEEGAGGNGHRARDHEP